MVHGYVVAASNKRMFIDMIDRGDRYEGVDRNPPLFRKTVRARARARVCCRR